MRSRFILAAVAAAAAVAVPATATAATPPPTPTDVLLELEHPAGLSAFVRSVSDPTSKHYRRYATIEQLSARFGAKPKAKASALRYLRAHGLRAEVVPGATAILAQGTPTAIAAALPTAGARAAGTGSARLTVPAALRGSVRSATRLTTPVSKASTRADADPYNGLSDKIGSALPHSGTAAGCPEGVNAPGQGGTGFTPNQFAGAYGLDVLHRAGFAGEGMHVALVETGGFNRSDIETFAACFGATMPQLRAINLSGGDQLPASNETTLDIEVLIGALPRLSKLDVYEAQLPKVSLEGDLLRALAQGIGSKDARPDVVSISYGLCEPLLISSLGTIATAHAMDRVAQLAVGSGMTIVASTGDDGWSGCERIVPSAIPTVAVPSTLPHVTAVGGTNALLGADNHIIRETAWNDTPLGGNTDAGGGGRSLLFERPWWQKAPGVQSFDRTVPDVSAIADPIPGYTIFCTADACKAPGLPDGGWQTAGGTSAATPLVASGIVLADQAARKAGQPNLGFVNPLVYGLARGTNPGFVLNDITIGSNDVGAGVPAQAGGGSPAGFFKARPGYDEATGLGSLKFAALNQLALRAGARTGK